VKGVVVEFKVQINLVGVADEQKFHVVGSHSDPPITITRAVDPKGCDHQSRIKRRAWIIEAIGDAILEVSVPYVTQSMIDYEKIK